MVNKYYNEEGKVAVLYSPAYGAGWSTWIGANKAEKEFVLFDIGLVELALEFIEGRQDLYESDEKLEKYLKESAYPNLGNEYLGGWSDIKIMWLEPDTRFYVKEYDGNESIIFEPEMFYYA